MTQDYRDYGSFVMLVDRAAAQADKKGAIALDDGRSIDGELIYDGVRIPIKPKFAVIPPVAEFLFTQSSQQMVHTTDGLFVRRLGIEDCPNRFLDRVGPEAADCSPITIDKARREGWDVDSTGRDPAKVVFKTTPTDQAALREKLGAVATTTVGGRER